MKAACLQLGGVGCRPLSLDQRLCMEGGSFTAMLLNERRMSFVWDADAPERSILPG